MVEGPGAVRQLRLVVATEEAASAVAFFRDVLGMPVEEAYDGPDGARVTILGAGRATLEIANPAQQRYIDEVEVGRQVAGSWRVALEVPDAAAASEAAAAGGAAQVAPPTRTPWDSLNARLDAPGGIHLTLFEELAGSAVTSGPDVAATLHPYLTAQREAVLWKVDGLSERDLRQPRTPTGTSLLGLVKHLAYLELGYFGECFGRDWPEHLLAWRDAEEPDADLWATAEESPELVVGAYRDAIARSDALITSLPADAVAQVPWWDPPRTTLAQLLVHMTAETARHAGHVDVLRETLDGRAGLQRQATNLPEVDGSWREEHVARLRRIAEGS